MHRLATLIRLLGILVLGGGLLGLVAAAGVYWHLAPQLPPVDVLREVRLQVPLRVLDADGALLAEFGEKRRVPLALAQVPARTVQAVLASEDDRFYEHPGVDWQGLIRAVAHLIRTGEKGPGGSTITMQVARNFFLGREKTYVRKLNEILLALRIERDLSKDEILELYLNKIFLGHRAYGVGAAAQVYYGKPLAQLSLAQTAMIAGLPKAPSRFNPVANPVRAIERRNYVLGRMRELDFITQPELEQALAAPVTARVHAQRADVESAEYAAEMARAWMEERFGEDAYTAGFKVHTTVRASLQAAAVRALRSALMEYDTRHGYRGAEQNGVPPASEAELAGMLSDVPVVGGLLPGVVLEVEERSARVFVKGAGPVEVPWEGLSWARRQIDENRRGPAPKRAADVVSPGDLVRLTEVDAPRDEKKKGRADPVAPQSIWRLTQIPDVEGALVALSPRDGSILAIMGGFDFYRSKFNRATQAERQPGSSFKPFIYSAAIEFGFNAGSIINDAPVVFDDPSLEAAWRPENYSGKFFGPTRLREALYKSRNLVSIRLLRTIGIDYAVDHISRFGFELEALPRNLSLALGSATVKPIEVAAGYAVLANGGFRVEPYLIERVESDEKGVVYEAMPAVVCDACEQAPAAAPSSSAGPPPRLAERVLREENVWLMHSLLRDVIARGTGRRARALGRKDIAGKTGTTNDQHDAWFSGFNREVVATAWVGFDQLAPMGRRETGGRAALPMWIDFMRVALDGRPETFMKQPEGLVSVRIDPRTGKLAQAGDPDAIFEFFHADRAPEVLAEAGNEPGKARAAGAPAPDSQVTKQLF
jgi:penicillin-binding protein 1A